MSSEAEPEPVGTSETPRFLEPISGTEAEASKPAQFNVTVAGVPAPQVQWFREGHQIQHNGEFQVQIIFFMNFIPLSRIS